MLSSQNILSELGTCSSLLTSNIEYGDIMIGFFSILQLFAAKQIWANNVLLSKASQSEKTKEI
jgi:hypothetical protein